eukprot:COSAG01_NODE_8110_length_2916_cov_8.073101_1_plen_127_part_00
MTCWRGAARRVLTALAVLVAALPSAAAGAAAASPPPPTDMALLVARLGRLEAAVREQARETKEARADGRALERRVAELEAEREDASARRRVQQPTPQPCSSQRRSRQATLRWCTCTTQRSPTQAPA